MLGIARFWVRALGAHVFRFSDNETDSENGVISLIMHLHLLMTASRVSSLRQASGRRYDYDGAINLLSSSTYASDESVTAAIDEYNATKEKLWRADPRKVTHVFFHTLIMDTSKAFDGDSPRKGLYNQVMRPRMNL